MSHEDAVIINRWRALRHAAQKKGLRLRVIGSPDHLYFCVIDGDATMDLKTLDAVEQWLGGVDTLGMDIDACTGAFKE